MSPRHGQNVYALREAQMGAGAGSPRRHAGFDVCVKVGA